MSMFGLKLDGLDEAMSNLDGIASGSNQLMGSVVEKKAKQAYAISQNKVPVASGALKASGDVVDGTDRPTLGVKPDASPRWVVFYGDWQHISAVSLNPSIVYAWDQHESLEYNHPRQGEAKYLEKAGIIVQSQSVKDALNALSSMVSDIV